MSELRPSPRRGLRTDLAPAPIGGYSQAIEANGFVFLAGQGPAEPGTGLVRGEDIAGQTAATIGNLEAILAVAGCTLGDVVKSTVHLADLADFDGFDAVYRSRFPEPPPARTTVQSVLMDILVEIDVIAVAPSH